MMLHETMFKNLILKRVHEELIRLTGTIDEKELIFDNKIEGYQGLKLHHNYPFLIKKENQIIYLRSVTGSTILEVYSTLKNKNFYVYKKIEGTKFKVRLKKN